MGSILVLGVGNVLMTDEAIGVRTVEYLQAHYDFPSNVTLMEGGTLGLMLMEAIMGADTLIVLDAVLGGGEPGTVYRLTGEDLRKSLGFRDSTHQLDLVDTLIYCEMAGSRPSAVVLGMQPFDYKTLAAGMSECMQNAMPHLVQALMHELKGYGVEATLKAVPESVESLTV